MEKVEATVTLSEDGMTLTITPSTIEDNSLYKITIEDAIDVDGNTVPKKIFEFRTPYSPLYCSLESLKLLVDTFNIPDENMYCYIREASKYADFVSGGKADETSFAVEQFTRTKATIDCLLRTFMDRTYSGGGSTYTLDAATYQDSLNSNAFKSIIDALRKELQKWQDAIRGYYNEGRVKPKATRIGIKASENSDVSHTTVDLILDDISRSMPQWK